MNETDDRIKQLLIESLDDELGPRLSAPAAARPYGAHPLSPRVRRPARWTTPLWVAAAVAAVLTVAGLVVALSGVLPSRQAASNPETRGPGIQVTCATVDGKANVQPDVPILRQRASAFTRSAPTVTASRSTVTVDMLGATGDGGSQLCSSTAFELRPLVTAPVPRSASTGPNLLRTLKFRVPSTPTAFAHLTATQKAQLAHAVARTQCGSSTTTAPASPTVVCTTGASNGSITAALLGSPVVERGTAAAAHAQPRTVGSPEWTVTVTLTPTASRAWTAYTARHNTAGSTPARGPAHCGTVGQLPCSDYVGAVLDGRLLTLAATKRAATDASIQIPATFTKISSERLTADLNLGVFPVPLMLQSLEATK